jgi:hypothetical protein
VKPFPAKDPREVVILGFDYSRLLGAGETISSAVWTAEDSDGVSATSAIVSGAPTVDTSLVKQIVIAGTLGETYTHYCLATTSAGRSLMLSNTQAIVKGGYRA